MFQDVPHNIAETVAVAVAVAVAMPALFIDMPGLHKF